MMYLNVDNISITINIDEKVLLNKRGKNTSAMSYLSKAPLQCFQEVNIMDGSYSGEVIINDETKHINGKVYMEKTYGNKFPEKWIWIQCNHFNKEASGSRKGKYC